MDDQEAINYSNRQVLNRMMKPRKIRYVKRLDKKQFLHFIETGKGDVSSKMRGRIRDIESRLGYRRCVSTPKIRSRCRSINGGDGHH